MKISRKRVIDELTDLDNDDPNLDDEERQNYSLKSDDELIGDYCLSGLFANNFSGQDENDIEGLE